MEQLNLFKLPRKEAMVYFMPNTIYGKPSTTFDLIIDGKRRSTTRFWKKIPKVGEIIIFYNKKREEIKVKVTKITKITDELKHSLEFRKRWELLEGWKWEDAEKRGFIHGHQVEFIVLEKPFEVSSAGTSLGKKFSAFYAKLKKFNNKTIEEIYQTVIKGYSSIKEGKGKPPKKNISKEQLYQKYKNLWKIYIEENPMLAKELYEKTLKKGIPLRDRFAKTEINQAKVLTELLNEKFNTQKRTLNTPPLFQEKHPVIKTEKNKDIAYENS